MSNPEQPTNPESPAPEAVDAQQPTLLPPASTLPESTPLASAPMAPTQAFPPASPNAAPPVYPGAPAAPGAPADYTGQVPPMAPGYPAMQQPGAQAPMNTLAIVAFVSSFFVGLVGIICGHISLKQIKRDGTRGRGLALAGTIIGYVSTAIWILSIILMIVASIAAAGLAKAGFDSAIDSEFGDLSSEITEMPGTDSSTGSESASNADFCAAIDAASTISGDDPAAAAEAFQKLADTAPSAESAALYQQFADMMRDPAGAASDPNIDFDTLQSDFASAIMSDAMACM